jgi:hypothetical protein
MLGLWLAVPDTHADVVALERQAGRQIRGHDPLADEPPAVPFAGLDDGQLSWHCFPCSRRTFPQACSRTRRMTPRFSWPPRTAPAASFGSLSDRLAPRRRRPRARQRFHHLRQLRPSIIGLALFTMATTWDGSAAGCGAAHGASHSLGGVHCDGGGRAARPSAG